MKYKEKLFAIGEVGLDYTPRFLKTENDKAHQQAVLKAQIDLSKKYELPL